MGNLSFLLHLPPSVAITWPPLSPNCSYFGGGFEKNLFIPVRNWIALKYLLYWLIGNLLFCYNTNELFKAGCPIYGTPKFRYLELKFSKSDFWSFLVVMIRGLTVNFIKKFQKNRGLGLYGLKSIVWHIKIDSLTALWIKWGQNEEKMLPAHFQLIRARLSRFGSSF